MCGDSTNAKDVATLMDGALADLWLTDPPYNVAYKGGTSDGLTIQNDDMEDNNFRKFLGDSFAVALQNMRNGAAFYIWHADVNGYTFRAACHDVAIQIRSCLIWNKNQLVLGRQDYQWKHEPCLYGWKDGASHYFRDVRTETTVIDHTKPVDDMNREELEEELLMLRNAIPTTVIDEKRPTKNLEHPTMKPVKLFARLIRNSTKRGDIVLDLFGGSGSTMSACEQTGRIPYIMELDPRYCDVIRRRYWKLKTGVEDGWEEGTRVTNKPVGKIV
nr:MAG TPA: adenine specific DNA methyltransferase [Caudoviricetes sp.]